MRPVKEKLFSTGVMNVLNDMHMLLIIGNRDI